MDHEEYYSRYDNLSHMIRRAYTMLYSIEAIGDSGTPTLNPFNAVGYIDMILRYMLGLTICEICYDSNRKANTIPRLHNWINGGDAETPIIPIRDALKTDLTDLRNQYLAHNDKKKREDVKIPIDDMGCLLNELRKWLNSLCRPDLDSRVSEITDDESEARKKVVYAGFRSLLDGKSRVEE